MFGALEELNQSLGRTVNPTLYTSEELAQRQQRGDAFVSRVLAQPKIWLIGGEDEITRSNSV